MSQTLRVNDTVILVNGPSPKMLIVQIDDKKQMATCAWFDADKRKTVIKHIPLASLEKTSRTDNH